MNQEQLNNWRAAETTQEVVKQFQQEIDDCLARLSSGEVIGETIDATAMEVCRLTGMVRGLSKIFELEYDDPDQE